jgi:hypothetical protein
MHPRRQSLSVACFLFLPALLCDDTKRTEIVDDGDICVRSTSRGDLDVRVEFPTCLSGSCDKVVSTSCSFELTGTELLVHSRAVIDSHGGECTLDCRVINAACTLSDVAPGEYTVIHGDDREIVTLPVAPSVLFDRNGNAAFCTSSFDIEPDAG